MAISLASLIRTGDTKRPARILVHGVQGIGKTTFAAAAPNPVFIQCEDGPGNLDYPAFPLAKSFDDVMGAIGALYEEKHDFGAVVLDTVDWLEPLIHAKACEDNGWADIEAPGYGKGYAAASVYWRRYIDGMNMLRDDKGMWVIQLAHTRIKRFEPPDTEPYDHYIIKLRDAASALLQEHADIVLFLNQQVSITKSDAKFGQKSTRAVGAGTRIAYTAERPAFLAKNRYGLPDSVYLPTADWAPLWDAIHAGVGV